MIDFVYDAILSETPLIAPDNDPRGESGAIVDFWGVVRRLEEGAELEGIEYEAHRVMAEHQLRRVAEEAGRKFQLIQVVIHHRIGFVRVAEASLFVRVGSRHRATGFRAIEWTVDRLKSCAPIWKHPRFKASSVSDSKLAPSFAA